MYVGDSCNAESKDLPDSLFSKTSAYWITICLYSSVFIISLFLTRPHTSLMGMQQMPEQQCQNSQRGLQTQKILLVGSSSDILMTRNLGSQVYFWMQLFMSHMELTMKMTFVNLPMHFLSCIFSSMLMSYHFPPTGQFSQITQQLPDREGED